MNESLKDQLGLQDEYRPKMTRKRTTDMSWAITVPDEYKTNPHLAEAYRNRLKSQATSIADWLGVYAANRNNDTPSVSATITHVFQAGIPRKWLDIEKLIVDLANGTRKPADLNEDELATWKVITWLRASNQVLIVPCRTPGK